MKLYNEVYDESKLIAWVDLSTYCNAACPQCHRTCSDGSKVDWLPLIQWDLETFKKAFSLKEILHYSEFEMCGTWGDPVMNKDIFEIVSYILKHSTANIKINTNGSLRDEHWWWKLGSIGGKRLSVWFDVDGITQEMHERYRQKTDLEKIKHNIEAFCSTDAISNVMTIVFKHNQNHLKEIEEMVREWGINGEVVSVPSNRFDDEEINTYDNGIVLEKADGY